MVMSSLSPIPVLRSLVLGTLPILLLAGSARAQDKPVYLPEPKHTPGDTLEVTRADLCGGRNKALESRIPVRVKSQVFDLYGVRMDGSVAFNIDHLVPVSLGGTNALKNLWPQPLAGEWGYAQKNRLERQLQKLVCSGRLELKSAQEEIMRNWVEAYKKYVIEAKQTKSGRT